jgi:hypothetical protein
MAARDDREIDWVDVNRVTRDGSVIQFVMLSQYGTIAAIKQSADRMAAIRIVQGIVPVTTIIRRCSHPTVATTKWWP